MRTLLIWAGDDNDHALVRVELSDELRTSLTDRASKTREMSKADGDLWSLTFWHHFSVYSHANPAAVSVEMESDRVVLENITSEVEESLGPETRTDYVQIRIDRDGDVSFVVRLRHASSEMETDCVSMKTLYPVPPPVLFTISLVDCAGAVVDAWRGADSEDIGNEFFRGEMETLAHLLFAAQWPNTAGWMFGELADALGKQARSALRAHLADSPLEATTARKLAQAWTEHIQPLTQR